MPRPSPAPAFMPFIHRCRGGSSVLSWSYYRDEGIVTGGQFNSSQVRNFCGFFCLVGFLTPSPTARLYRGRALTVTSKNLTCCNTELDRGDHDLCLGRSHYTDPDPTNRKRTPGAGIEPMTSRLGVARSTELLSSSFFVDKQFSQL